MNDFFKYFDKLNSIFKSTIIAIAVLMPFWYISFYLINQKLFLNIDFPLRLLFLLFNNSIFLSNIIFNCRYVVKKYS